MVPLGVATDLLLVCLLLQLIVLTFVLWLISPVGIPNLSFGRYKGVRQYIASLPNDTHLSTRYGIRYWQAVTQCTATTAGLLHGCLSHELECHTHWTGDSPPVLEQLSLGIKFPVLVKFILGANLQCSPPLRIATLVT